MPVAEAEILWLADELCDAVFSWEAVPDRDGVVVTDDVGTCEGLIDCEGVRVGV